VGVGEGGGYSTLRTLCSPERRPPMKVESLLSGLMAREGGEQPKIALVLGPPLPPEPKICCSSLRMPLGLLEPAEMLQLRQDRIPTRSPLDMKPFMAGGGSEDVGGAGAARGRWVSGGRWLPGVLVAPRERMVSVSPLRGSLRASMRGDITEKRGAGGGGRGADMEGEGVREREGWGAAASWRWMTC